MLCPGFVLRVVAPIIKKQDSMKSIGNSLKVFAKAAADLKSSSPDKEMEELAFEEQIAKLESIVEKVDTKFCEALGMISRFMMAVRVCRMLSASDANGVDKDNLLKEGLRTLEQLTTLVEGHLDHNYMLTSCI